MSVASHLQRVIKSGGDMPAIHFGEQRTTWNALEHLRQQLDAVLSMAGLDRSAIVGLIGRNSPAVVSAFVSLIAADRAVCLINALRPPNMVAEEVKGLALGAVIADERDIGDDIVTAAETAGTMLIALARSGETFAIEALVSRGREHVRRREGDTIIEIQTSGTTGKPKRISVAERTLGASLRDGARNAQGTVAEPDITPKRSPGIMFNPLVHTSGAFNTLMSMFEARPLILLERFDVEAFRRVLRVNKPKFLPLPPTALRMLLDSNATAEEFESVMTVRCGTAALGPELQAAFEERFGVPVLTTYGATEFMGVVTSWTLSDYKTYGAAKRGSVGRPQKGVSIRVVDALTGAELASGEEGVLEAKLDRIDEGRAWIRTTDIARIDSDGFLFILGRADDAISRGGFKIMASAVAEVLRAHPDVQDVVVVGRQDRRLGETPVAVVEPRVGSSLTPDAILAFARTRLAPYECPARVHFVAELPRTVSDKVAVGEVRRWLDQFDG